MRSTIDVPAPPSDLAMLDTPEALVAVGHSVRRRILEELRAAADSPSGLAERLGDSRQRINYHVRALEEAGLVELAEEIPRRGLVEKVYRPVGRTFALDPALLGSLDAGDSIAEGDRWAAAYAIALASRVTREVAALRSRAAREGKRLAVASLASELRLADPQAMEAFVDDLARAIADVVARHDDANPAARPFRLTCCSHPASTEAAGPAQPKER